MNHLCMTAVVLGLLVPGGALAANPASGTTGTGQTLNIQITSPADGVTVDETVPLTVSGVASTTTNAISAPRGCVTRSNPRDGKLNELA